MAGGHHLPLPAHDVDGDGVGQEAAPLPPSAQSEDLRGEVEVAALLSGGRLQPRNELQGYHFDVGSLSVWTRNIEHSGREKCKNLVCGLDGEVVLERNITLVTW